jgi:very-short-patch-repair endonuclease
LKKSPLEATLIRQIEERRLPEAVPQGTAPWKGTGRRFLGDLVWPAHRLLVEVDGGTWVRGRHTTGVGFERDCVKQNLAVLNGYRVLRVTGGHVKNGMAVQWIADALGVSESAEPPVSALDA